MKLTFKDKIMAEALNFYRINKMLPDDDADKYNDEYADDAMADIADEEDYADLGTEDADTDVNALGDEAIDDIVAGVSGNDEDMDDETLFGDLDLDEENPDGDPNENTGLIRTVKGAYMVYKRMTPENNYEELWIYNIKDVKYQTKIRNSILAGTDVDPVTLISPDGEQRADIYTKGNVQFVHIDGLPN
jgi:hypothetical protein